LKNSVIRVSLTTKVESFIYISTDFYSSSRNLLKNLVELSDCKIDVYRSFKSIIIEKSFVSFPHDL